MWIEQHRWRSAEPTARWLLMASAVLLLAATWHGVFDTDPNQNPRSMERWEIAAFITSVVNPRLQTTLWSPGDTLTICQGGSNTCMIVAYIPGGTDAWAVARHTDSRERPPEATYWERFWKWLLPNPIPISLGSLNSIYSEWAYESLPVGTVTVGDIVMDGYVPSGGEWVSSTPSMSSASSASSASSTSCGTCHD